MNKAELIEALTARLGEKKSAVAALDAVLTEIQHAVAKGERVAITGFGVFEKRTRGARTARNPRTGEAVKVKKTNVPAFKAGTGFKEMVASGKVPKAAKKAAAKTTAAAKKTAAKKTAVKKTTAKKATAKKTTAAKKTTGAKKTAAKKTAKKAPARKTATRTTAARKTAAKKTTRKAAGARRR